MDIVKALVISASGMEAQTSRLQTMAKSLSNGGTPGSTQGSTRRLSPGGLPGTKAGYDDVRVHGANLSVLEATRGLLTRTLELLG